jgi:hypothetical protein
MTSIGNGHLTDKQMLFYVDGELAFGESARIRRHLEACWTCRAKLEDLQVVIKKIVDFRDQILLPMVPAPPRPWDGLDPRMHESDGTRRKPSLADRLSSLFRSAVLEPRYAVFAVLVLAAVGAWVWWPSQPAISASELLARVQAAQSTDLGRVAAPVLHQRLRVRRTAAGSTDQASADYDSWEDQSRGRFRQMGSSAEVLTELRTIFNANQLDWQAPLSAAGYARWRDSLPAKEDIVAPATDSTAGSGMDGSGPLTLTTIAGNQAAKSMPSADSDADRITKAELVVRTADWHPVEERLWVDDRKYEIAELDYKVLPLSEVGAAVFAEPPASVEPVEAPHPVLTETTERLAPPPPDPEETEMAVRYGLHQLEADLGEPIQISHGSHGKIIVDALGVAPELQAKLKDQLVSIPNTGLEIDRTPGPSCEACPLPPQEPAMVTPSRALSFAPVVNPNEKRLEEIFGDPHAQESFTQEVLAASGDALAHGFALRDLALRYTPEEEGKLRPAAKAQLEEMVGDHLAALTEQTSRLQGLIRPLLEALSTSNTAEWSGEDAIRSDEPRDVAGPGLKAGSDSPLPSSAWQNASLEMFASLERADRLIKGLLTSTNTPFTADHVVPELRQALSEQQQELKQFQGWAQQLSNAPHP